MHFDREVSAIRWLSKIATADKLQRRESFPTRQVLKVYTVNDVRQGGVGSVVCRLEHLRHYFKLRVTPECVDTFLKRFQRISICCCGQDSHLRRSLVKDVWIHPKSVAFVGLGKNVVRN